MAELSILVDESGEQEGPSGFYLVTLVFHDQAMPIDRAVAGYHADLAAKGLPDVPFHVGSLKNGHDAFENLDLAERRRLMACFSGFVRRIDVRYRTLAYPRREVGTTERLAARLAHDLRALFVENQPLMQSHGVVKTYYDDGQPVLASVLKESLADVLGKQAVRYRNADPKHYLLLQAADYICDVELAAIKYGNGAQTATDERFYGNRRQFMRDVRIAARARRRVLEQWQARKRREVTHPYLKEKIRWGEVPFAQAMLLAKHLRGDLDGYPPFFWK